jgi:transcriptional regulator with XRE-family HTH domain
MTVIRIVAETKDTVTLRRQDWTDLLAALEDAEDRAAVRSRRGHEAEMGKEALRQNYLTGEEARRLLDGESPVRVWRGKRGLTQRALAASAGVAVSYLSDIESGRKPGSADAISRLARALGVSMEDLMDEPQPRRKGGDGPVYLQTHPSAADAGFVPNAASREEFASIDAVLAAVRDRWPTLQVLSPAIVGEYDQIIFGQEDLWQMMTSKEPAVADDFAFAEPLCDKANLSTYEVEAISGSERICCRVAVEVFRDYLNAPQAKTRDFPGLFQKHRPVLERAFRLALRGARGVTVQQDGSVMRKIVLDSDNFPFLAGLGRRSST